MIVDKIHYGLFESQYKKKVAHARIAQKFLPSDTFLFWSQSIKNKRQPKEKDFVIERIDETKKQE